MNVWAADNVESNFVSVDVDDPRFQDVKPNHGQYRWTFNACHAPTPDRLERVGEGWAGVVTRLHPRLSEGQALVISGCTLHYVAPSLTPEERENLLEQIVHAVRDTVGGGEVLCIKRSASFVRVD
jgi:hypothetical protein